MKTAFYEKGSAIELIGFGMYRVTWLDEYVDVPFRFLGSSKRQGRPRNSGSRRSPRCSLAQQWW